MYAIRAQNRLNELTDLIEKERDHETFTKFSAELNALLDGNATQQIANRIAGPRNG